MPDMMVIVSKAVFDKDLPAAKLGAVLPMKVYRSASKHLERLAADGRLFLVTVRPPNEALWLVAVLEDLKFDGSKWQARRNRYPVTDIGSLKSDAAVRVGEGNLGGQGGARDVAADAAGAEPGGRRAAASGDRRAGGKAGAPAGAGAACRARRHEPPALPVR